MRIENGVIVRSTLPMDGQTLEKDRKEWHSFGVRCVYIDMII